MKQFIIALFLLISSSVCIAQTEHMKFKGIPIDGPLNSFVQKLKDKGFSYIGTRDGIALLEGEFATKKGCSIGVSRFSDRDQVCMVIVLFPEEETWSSITQTYYSLKGLLTEKYGTPETTEYFSNHEPSSDALKFHYLLKDECHYLSEFACENGNIQLSMTKQSYNTASVILRYIDKANADETRQRIIDDL